MPPKKKILTFDIFGFPKAHTEDVRETIGYAIGKSELGLVLVATCEFGILAVLRGKTKGALIKDLESLFPKDDPIKDEWDAQKALSEVIKFIDRPGYVLNYPIFMQGTEFQKKVWKAVQEVPFGKTATYLEIAEKIGAPRAMRAVGSSCTRNKLFLIVPCHRIVRNDYKVPDDTSRKKTPGNRETLLEREIRYIVT